MDNGYDSLEKAIKPVKSKVMEYLESNEEARYMVEKIGEAIEHLNPDDLFLSENISIYEKTYRPIEIDDMKVLREKTRKLDFYQRKTVERGIQFSRKVVKALKDKNQSPKSLGLVVQGGAGSSKSTD